MYAVIMAGGRGTRFWPLSRTEKPKHLLNITGEKTVIQLTVERIKPLIPKENILIVTGIDHASEVAAQLPDIPEGNIIIEPMGRNTAPCIGLAALHIKRRTPHARMAVLPSDHLITDEDLYRATLAAAFDAAGRSPSLVTVGVEPTRPETGYGYIERGETAGTVGDRTIFTARSYREKPDRETALAFIEDGGFLWNSGMFVWSVSAILKEIEALLPDLYEELLLMEKFIGTKEEEATVHASYEKIRPVSIDYGIMEKSRNVLLMEGDFGWSDIGSWDALWDILEKDSEGNALRGTVLQADTSNSLVFGGGKLIATVGISDCIVVDTEDALLICRRGCSQDVRKIIEQLEEKKLTEYL